MMFEEVIKRINDLKLSLDDLEDQMYVMKRGDEYHLRDPLHYAESDLDYVIGNNLPESEIIKCHEKIADIKKERLDSLKEYYHLLDESNDIREEIINFLYSLCDMLEDDMKGSKKIEDASEYLSIYEKEITMYEEHLDSVKSDLKDILYDIQEQDPDFVLDMITENSRASVLAEKFPEPIEV